MKLAFFGTSDRSTPILEALKKHFELVLCVTKSDSRVGRKQIVKESGVKAWAKANQIEFIEVKNLKESSAELVLKRLRELNVEFGVVADFSIIIPTSIIQYFNSKLINIHFSILPKYRGASPVQFALKNGDKITGITYLLVAEGIDDGDILQTIEYKIETIPTSGELYKILFELAGQKLPQVIENYLKKTTLPQKQNSESASYTYSPNFPKSTFIYKEDAKIDWNKPLDQIEREIRAYNPWPVAWTFLSQLRLPTDCVLKPNVQKALKVKIYSAVVRDGNLIPEKLQVEGKGPTDWKAFENGYLVKTSKQSL